MPTKPTLPKPRREYLDVVRQLNDPSFRPAVALCRCLAGPAHGGDSHALEHRLATTSAVWELDSALDAAIHSATAYCAVVARGEATVALVGEDLKGSDHPSVPPSERIRIKHSSERQMQQLKSQARRPSPPSPAGANRPAGP